MRSASQIDAELRERFRDYVNLAHRGLARLPGGEFVAIGRLERLAVERHLRDLERWPTDRQDETGFRFNATRGFLQARFFAEHVRHTKGDHAGELVDLTGFEVFVLVLLFGWQTRNERGQWVRRFREVYMSVARKNAKTFLAAGIGLILLVADGEVGAEVYTAATRRDQAKIAWSQAAGFVKQDRLLRSRAIVHRATSTITVESTGSFCQALAAAEDSLEGKNPHGAIIDELHVHKNRAVWDTLQTGMGARSQPLMFGITTAGVRREGLCWEEEADAVKVLEGVIEDEARFAIVCRLDEDDDAWDERNWRKANPLLDVAVYRDALRADAAKAQREIGYRNKFLRHRMNLWTEADRAWLPLSKWDRCVGAVDLEALRGRACFLGIDMSSTTDLTAITAVWPHEDGSFAVWPWAFCPADTIGQRGPKERRLFEGWVAAGLLTATAGDMVDQDAIWQEILNLVDRYDVREIAFDRWNASALITKCRDVLGDERVVGFGQGYGSMSPAMKGAEALIGARKIRHGGNPLLRWAMANVSVRKDTAENMKPDKEKASDRFDPVVAMIMALARATTAPTMSEPAFWSMSS